MNQDFHRQQDWLPLEGEFVEIRLDDKPIRSGRVDAVTTDGEILWISALGAEPRMMFERFQGFTAWLEFTWENATVSQ